MCYIMLYYAMLTLKKSDFKRCLHMCTGKQYISTKVLIIRKSCFCSACFGKNHGVSCSCSTMAISTASLPLTNAAEKNHFVGQTIPSPIDRLPTNYEERWPYCFHIFLFSFPPLPHRLHGPLLCETAERGAGRSSRWDLASGQRKGG